MFEKQAGWWHKKLQACWETLELFFREQLRRSPCTPHNRSRLEMYLGNKIWLAAIYFLEVIHVVFLDHYEVEVVWFNSIISFWVYLSSTVTSAQWTSSLWLIRWCWIFFNTCSDSSAYCQVWRIKMFNNVCRIIVLYGASSSFRFSVRRLFLDGVSSQDFIIVRAKAV